VADRVKRSPRNPDRGGQARTRFARRAVVDAARALFLERGYVATTIDAISERSDVPAATVYRLFSSKLGILHALLDTSIAGDDQPVPLQERPDVAAIFAASDPRKLLSAFVEVAVAINARSNDLYRILSSAAVSDPAAAELFGDYQRQRAEGQSRVARSLARARALRPGLRERDAADLIHALVSPELYRLLVVDRAWPLDRYEQWLLSTLESQLTVAGSPPD
jgi:AcrR family transcriptional regulator